MTTKRRTHETFVTLHANGCNIRTQTGALVATCLGDTRQEAEAWAAKLATGHATAEALRRLLECPALRDHDDWHDDETRSAIDAAREALGER